MRILTCLGPQEARAIAGRLIPFRAPHHSTSPGGLESELRLSVGGVLYLDECGMFKREALSVIRRAIENHARFGHPMPLAIVLDTTGHGPPNLTAKPSDGEREAARNYSARVSTIVELFNDAGAGRNNYEPTP